MAVEKTALRVTELDFLSIRSNLKDFLRSQNEFTDFDFEGSGMSVLLDILAYNTHYQAYYLNMVGNEMFLDTAQLRNSVLSHAKLLGYVPNSTQGALSQIDITVTPSDSEDQDQTGIVLERYTKLMGTDIDGINYPFVTLNANTSIKADGSFAFSNVAIKQGEPITRQFIMDISNEDRKFVLPSSNVDIQTIRVAVQESVANSDTVIYTLNEDITELSGESPVYFLEENENLTYTLQFGDDVIGKRPKDGNVIVVTYLDNVGGLANNISRFVFAEPVAGLYSDDITVAATAASYGGQEKETVEQVRHRAPYWWTTQNRAVNYHDYETLLLKDYNYIESISVWGGEDNDPVVYGKVFMSIKTRGNYMLTNFEKERLKTQLIQTRNMMTITPEIVDPDYVYMVLNSTIRYDSKLTNLTQGDIENLVRAAIQDYNENELNRFDSVFRKSKLQSYIENADKSILSSELDVYVQKRVLLDTDNIKAYNILFNSPLGQSAGKKLYTFPTIELFDTLGTRRACYLEEVPQALSGIAGVNVIESGSGYTSIPTVTITGDGSGATATARIAAGRLTNIEITNAGQDYSYASVTVSGGGGSGASVSAVLEQNLGTLRAVYYDTTGTKIVLNANVGQINYKLGTITLNNTRVLDVEENDFYSPDYLTINVLAGADNILPIRNRILAIDFDNPKSIQVNVIAE
jgi:hypothetical protein